MTSEPNLLAVIQRQLGELNKSEAKVAKAILKAPEEATRSSIASLAAAAGVSEPSVNRFCKRFGATGFPADLIWCETATPNLAEAKKFADAIHEKFPGKLLAYNCSPSFNWKKHLSDDEIASFQQEIAKMSYKFQFITLAGFHTQNIAIFELAEKYKAEGMTAYSRIQQQEFSREKDGYTSVKHQREVGTSYFDAVSNTISSGKSSTTAMAGSTESEQF